MKTSSVVRVILKNYDNKILLVKHKGASFWSLPWWHIEELEDLYQALHREIKEEFNVKVEILWISNTFSSENISPMLLPISVYKIKFNSRKYWEVVNTEYIFNAKIISWKIKVQEEEIEEFNFFTKEEILDLEDVYSQIKDLLLI